MDDKRIYGSQVDIGTDAIKEFYDKRASRHTSGYTTVLLGDGDPEYARRWNQFEKDMITPYLNADSDKNVIDIGCGIGRWAESLSDRVGSYTGVDFSSEMIRVANENFVEKDNTMFMQMSFQDVFSNEIIHQKKYDVAIITGVSMYINENDLKKCFDSLTGLLNKGGIIYIEESVGVSERLTLKGVWSEKLNDNYAAIYRTRDEYIDLMSGLISKCEVIKDEYFSAVDKKELKETSHWYIILKVN